MDNRTALIWLHAIPELTEAARRKVLAAVSEPEEVWSLPVGCRAKLNERQQKALLAARSEACVDEVFEKLESCGARALTTLDDDFPPQLRGIPDAPQVLYLRGTNCLMNEKLIAVVGTRRPTSDGRLTASRLGEALAQNGVTVVSGLASGIDGCAQEGCVKAGGQSIAVMGVPIDQCYPPEHRDLLEEILDTGGCVVSEYLPGVRTRSYRFLERNRIISGLSRGVVVVEAGEESGATYTAQCARDQNRLLFAVPGSIYSAASAGSNRLLAQGALTALGENEILGAFSWPRAPKREPEPLPELDADSRRIVDFLQNEEKSFEEMVNQLKIETSELNSLLTILEMQGIIRQSAGKLYRALIH